VILSQAAVLSRCAAFVFSTHSLVFAGVSFFVVSCFHQEPGKLLGFVWLLMVVVLSVVVVDFGDRSSLSGHSLYLM